MESLKIRGCSNREQFDITIGFSPLDLTKFKTWKETIETRNLIHIFAKLWAFNPSLDLEISKSYP